MILETERLWLRPWEEADAQALYRVAKDPAIGPNAGWQPHGSPEESLQIIRNVLSKPETYAVVLKEEQKPVGSVGIHPSRQPATPESCEREIGYWIGVPYWGRGLIPEAVRALLRRCFEELGCTAVWCAYFDGNQKSKRVMEKCGFRYHHTEENKRTKIGEIRTEHFTRLTKEEWMELTQTEVSDGHCR